VRLWSFHPRYLDRQGLTACWRESLLAQAVVMDPERGYSRHPQLERFRDQPDPLAAVGAYLSGVADDADHRGYRFDRSRIRRPGAPHATMRVTRGQLEYEWSRLRTRMSVRSPAVWIQWDAVALPDPHPLFEVVAGPIAPWERTKDP
jgi:hypothetical protein